MMNASVLLSVSAWKAWANALCEWKRAAKDESVSVETTRILEERYNALWWISQQAVGALEPDERELHHALVMVVKALSKMNARSKERVQAMEHALGN